MNRCTTPRPRRVPALRGLLALSVVVAASAGSASGPSVPESAARQSLSSAIDKLLGRPELKGAAIGVHVIRLADGHDLYSREPDRLFIPASNMKLVTTAAVLLELGANYEFRTIAGSRGGDLVIVAGGDPAIGGRFTGGDPTAYLRRWAGVLRDQGIRRIDGDLVIDDSFFDGKFIHPNWPKSDVGHWYAAPVGAFILNDSCQDVRIEAGPKPDAPGSVALVPNTRFFKIDNRTRTVASTKAHAPRVYRKPGSRTILCDGGVYLRSQAVTGWVTVDDPGLYAAEVLREVLAAEGIPVAGRVRREAGAGRSPQFVPRMLHRFPLSAALAVTNKESQNLYAECLLKTLGAERGEGSWSNGSRIAGAAMGRIGLDSKSFVLDDGCGLSRSNRLSPAGVTQLLRAMHGGPHRDQFRDSLAVSGSDGTLAKRLNTEPYQGHIWAKTGSITGVRAISGYAETRSGDWLAFSFLVNNARTSVRGVQDEFCKLLVDFDTRTNLVQRALPAKE